MEDAAEDYTGLIHELRQVNLSALPQTDGSKSIADRLDLVGHAALAAVLDVSAFLQMLGAICLSAARVVRHPGSLRFTSLVYQIYRVGWQLFQSWF